MSVVEIRLPQFGMGMQDGTVARWLKQAGDAVVEGEAIAELETAKSVVELPAPFSGKITEIRVAEGREVPVQSVLALLETED